MLSPNPPFFRSHVSVQHFYTLAFARGYIGDSCTLVLVQSKNVSHPLTILMEEMHLDCLLGGSLDY